MSHEIRTPMNGVMGMTELALETELTAQQREYLEIVKSSSDALLRVINDILDFSKIEAGKLLIEKIPFDLNRMVGETLKILVVRAHAKGLKLVCRIAPEIPFAVVGDPGRLRQILMNLIGNAIKFTEHGEVVLRVDMAHEPDKLPLFKFSVKDSGMGIPAAKLHSIFEAFSQEDSSITRRFGGTGLGLSISSRLVEALGGRISVQSELGLGSLFEVWVPMALGAPDFEMADELTSLASHRGFVASQSALDILLVEDHVINQKLAIAVLSRWGHRVTVADNGQVALDILAQHQFDLVFMDMMMPVMDGLEATQRIRAQEPVGVHLPIVAMTANAMSADRERCLLAGMDDYISKPIELIEVQRVLARFSPAGLNTGQWLKPQQPPPDLTLKTQPDAAVAFDYDQALAESDQEVLDIVAEAFTQQWPLDLMQMKQALASGDLSPLLHTAHALKGTLGMFGARPVVALAQALEAMAGAASKELSAASVLAMSTHLALLQTQVEDMLAALGRR